MVRKIIRKILEESFSNLLNEKIGDFNYNKTFIPPSRVIETVKQAISKTGSKLEKAVELSKGQSQTFNQIRKLRDYFSSNLETKGDDDWNLHGGDACQQWVESELSKFHDQSLSTRQNLQKAGGAGEKKGRGVFDTTIMSTTKSKNI